MVPLVYFYFSDNWFWEILFSLVAMNMVYKFERLCIS